MRHNAVLLACLLCHPVTLDAQQFRAVFDRAHTCIEGQMWLLACSGLPFAGVLELAT